MLCVIFNVLQAACKAVTALIQYFLLSAFCWMMCEGVMLYLMLVVVFSKLTEKWWFFLLIGWGEKNIIDQMLIARLYPAFHNMQLMFGHNICLYTF